MYPLKIDFNRVYAYILTSYLWHDDKQCRLITSSKETNSESSLRKRHRLSCRIQFCFDPIVFRRIWVYLCFHTISMRCVHRRLETFDCQRKGIIIPLNVIPKSNYKLSNVFNHHWCSKKRRLKWIIPKCHLNNYLDCFSRKLLYKYSNILVKYLTKMN